MCVYVCFFLKIHVLKIVIERWFWELNMLIGSLVELHVGLHSCLCFSHLEKLVLKVSSTPPRYLAVCRASSAFSYRNPDSSSNTWWIDWEYFCLIDNFSIPSGSIEISPTSSTASRQLGRSIKILFLCLWFVPRYLFDTCICRCSVLSTPVSTPLDRSRSSVHALFFTCFAYFFYLCVYSILFLFFL